MTPPTALARALEPSQVPAFAAASRLMESSSHSLSTVYKPLYLGTDGAANQPPKPFASRWIGFAGDSRTSFFLSHCALFFPPASLLFLFSTFSFSHKRDTSNSWFLDLIPFSLSSTCQTGLTTSWSLVPRPSSALVSHFLLPISSSQHCPVSRLQDFSSFFFRDTPFSLSIPNHDLLQ